MSAVTLDRNISVHMLFVIVSMPLYCQTRTHGRRRFPFDNQYKQQMSDVPKKPGNKSTDDAVKGSGRVAFDARGNPVWEWKTADGEYDRNITTQELKKLEAKDLELLEAQDLLLQETRSTGQSNNTRSQTHSPLVGGGKNPYDSDAQMRGQVPGNTHPAMANQQSGKRAVSNSLVSKYGHTVKKKTEVEPQGVWDKLKAKIKGD